MKEKRYKRKGVWFGKLRRFLPLLHLHIQLPLLTIRTHLMGEVSYAYEFDYIALEIKIWKWSFQFWLYTTAQRSMRNR